MQVTRNQKLSKPDAQRAPGQVLPHKERGLWNFLTWSFFLVQMLAVDQLLGGVAKAAGELDLAGSNADAEPALLISGSAPLLEGAGNSLVEEASDSRSAGPAKDVVGAYLTSGRGNGQAIELEAIAAVQAVAALSLPGTASAGYAPASAELIPGDDVRISIANDIQGEMLDLVIDEVQYLLETIDDIGGSLDDVVSGITEPMLDTIGDVLDDTLNPIMHQLLGAVGDVAGSLDHVLDVVTAAAANLAKETVAAVNDLVGDVAAPLLETQSDAVPDVAAVIGDVAETAQPLHAALNLPTKVLDALAMPGNEGVLASPGNIIFPVHGSVALDELFSGNRYTDYNLALQTRLPPPIGGIGEAVATTTNAILGALPDAGESDTDHSLPAPHLIVPGILAELGLRGSGDGFV